MNSQALWYLTRGSGIVSLVLLTGAVVLGLTTKVRWSNSRWARFVIEQLHRNISLLSTIFVVVHIASAVFDSYVSISWLDGIIPFIGTYHPFWLGLGALSLDAFIAVAITSLIRSRVGHRAWRAVHWAAYGCWGLAVAHGLGIGSDRQQGWFLALNAACVLAVGAALAWRIAASRPRPTTTSATQPALAVLPARVPARSARGRNI